jgi:hypothetical protein
MNIAGNDIAKKNISPLLLTGCAAILLAIALLIGLKLVIVLLLAAVGIFLFATKKEKYIFYGALASIPLFELTQFMGSLTVTLVLGGGFACIWFFRVLVREATVLYKKETLLLAGLVAVILITSMAGVSPENSLYPLRSYVQSFSLMFLIYNIFTTKKDMKNLGWVLIVSITFVTLLALVEQYGIHDFGFQGIHDNENLKGFSKGNETVARYGGTRGDPNFWAVQLNVAFPFIIAYWLHYKKVWQRATLLLLSSILLMSFFTTYSIGGFIGLILIWTLSVLYVTNLKRSKKIVVIALTSIVTILVFLLLPDEYKYRIASKIYGREELTTGRIYTWAAGLKMLVSHPFAGVGPGNSFWELPKYIGIGTGKGRAVHNSFITFGSETGIIGLALFVGLIVVSLRGLSDAIKREEALHEMDYSVFGRALFICLAAFLLQAMALDLQEDKYLFILIGMAIAYKYSTRDKLHA